MIIKDIAEIQLNMRYQPELAACMQRSGLRASLGRVAMPVLRELDRYDCVGGSNHRRRSAMLRAIASCAPN